MVAFLFTKNAKKNLFLNVSCHSADFHYLHTHLWGFFCFFFVCLFVFVVVCLYILFYFVFFFRFLNFTGQTMSTFISALTLLNVRMRAAVLRRERLFSFLAFVCV